MDYEAIGSRIHKLGKLMPFTALGGILVQTKLTNQGVKIMAVKPLTRGHSESVSRTVSWQEISDSKLVDVFGHHIAILLDSMRGGASSCKRGTPR